MIKVSVVGAKGRMGSHVVEAVNNAEDTQLALALDAGDDLTQITTDNTDVVVEFTVPSVSLNNVLTLIGQGVDVVVGTTGWTDEKLAQVKSAIANGPKPETQKGPLLYLYNKGKSSTCTRENGRDLVHAFTAFSNSASSASLTARTAAASGLMAVRS